MSQSKLPETSPLTLQELQQIEATYLPVLDRHHLRLLAHCLAVFRQISGGCTNGPLPDTKSQQLWFSNQLNVVVDQEFNNLLIHQLQAAAVQLETIAAHNDCTPLGLDLGTLITSYSNDCYRRIKTQGIVSSPAS